MIILFLHCLCVFKYDKNLLLCIYFVFLKMLFYCNKKTVDFSTATETYNTTTTILERFCAFIITYILFCVKHKNSVFKNENVSKTKMQAKYSHFEKRCYTKFLYFQKRRFLDSHVPGFRKTKKSRFPVIIRYTEFQAVPSVRQSVL